MALYGFAQNRAFRMHGFIVREEIILELATLI